MSCQKLRGDSLHLLSGAILVVRAVTACQGAFVTIVGSAGSRGSDRILSQTLDVTVEFEQKSEQFLGFIRQTGGKLQAIFPQPQQLQYATSVIDVAHRRRRAASITAGARLTTHQCHPVRTHFECSKQQ